MGMPLKDLERLVMPAIMLRQFHITYAPIMKSADGTRNAANGKLPHLQPIAVELFALCSPSVAERLRRDRCTQLTLQDWRSGSEKTVVRSFSAQPRSVDKAE
jgi:hypothetical protein